jgi:hypothetical protein
VNDLETKEMSFEEKYDKLYDQYIMTDVISMAFIKEMGLADKYLEYQMKVYKKMMPSLLGSAFKLIKTLAPGRAFKKFVESILKDSQVTEPLSTTEIVSFSEKEAVIKYENSLLLKKYRDVMKKTGLKIDLKEYWELFQEQGKEMMKDFGFDVTPQIEGDSTITTITLKK